MRILTAFILLALTGFVHGENRGPAREIVHSVNRDSLLSYISRLEAFGTRDEFSPQRDSAAAYILSSFTRWGLQADSDWYKFGMTDLKDTALSAGDSLWVVGNNGLLLFSPDCGGTWHVQNTPAGMKSLQGITMLPNGIGIIVGEDGTILRTTDSGLHWSRVEPVTFGYLRSVSFGDADTGVIVGPDGAILRTTNSGASWRVVGSASGSLMDVQFISPATVVAVGNKGTIIRSTDGGETWVNTNSGLYDPMTGNVVDLYSVHFPDSLNGWTCGMGVLAETRDGGLTWEKRDFPSMDSQYLTGVFFSDSLHGCLLGYNTHIFMTDDGGQNWRESDDMPGSFWGPYFYRLRGIPGGRMVVAGSRSLVLTGSREGDDWNVHSGTMPSPVVNTSRNIVATIPGSVTPEIEVVLVAHYDSYCGDGSGLAPGANDNASGTAAVMETARICSRYRFACTLKFLAVSAEELGMYGSEHYVHTALKENQNIKCAVNADMIGYPLTGDTLHLAIQSYRTRNWLLDSTLVYNRRYDIGLNLIDSIDPLGPSDFGSFARAGYDALNIIEGTPEEIWGGADPFYHTRNDRSENLNSGLIRRAVQLMAALGAETAGVMGASTGIDRLAFHKPDEFLLLANHPNPFNPATTIVYRIPVDARVTLKMYDMLGREVETLVDDQRPAGVNTSVFYSDGLASGVYVCRLTVYDPSVGTQVLLTSSMRMTLVK